MSLIKREFFLQPTTEVARQLLGQTLVCESTSGHAAGRIVETEAYLDGDPGSHAWQRRTSRNAPMFGPPGTVYVYQIYGLYFCLNLVTQPEDIPEAVLIRALEPGAGLDLMRRRRGRAGRKDLCSGPGKLAQALGVDLRHNWGAITSPPLYLLRNEEPAGPISVGTRIGLSKGKGDEALLRFGLRDSEYLSRRFT
jgi:DNA-3-methyladenine glycosylase